MMAPPTQISTAVASLTYCSAEILVMSLGGKGYESLGTCFLVDVVDPANPSRRFALTAHHCVVECASLDRIDALLLRFPHFETGVKCIAAVSDYLDENDLALIELVHDPERSGLPCVEFSNTDLSGLQFIVRGCASGMRTQFSNFTGTVVGVENLRPPLSSVSLVELTAETFAHNLLKGISGAPICALATEPPTHIVIVGVVREVANREVATSRFYGSSIAQAKQLAQRFNLDFRVVNRSELPLMQMSRLGADHKLRPTVPSSAEEMRNHRLYVESVISRWDYKTSPLLPADVAFPSVAVDLEVRTRDGTKPILAEYSRDTYPLSLNRRLQLENLLFDEVSSRNVVVLGDPGGGKTTLLQMVAARLASRALEAPEGRLPVIISLAEFGSAMSKTSTWCLNDAFEVQLAALGVREAPQFLKGALDKGRVALLLDGYDEINDNDRDRVIERLIVPLRVHKSNCITVTSRKVGFHSLKGFDVFEIAPLTLDQQKQLLTEICGTELCASVLRFLAGNADLRDMAAVPLTLTILAVIAREYSNNLEPLMESRCQLLRTAIQLLLEGRHRRAGGTRDPAEAENLLAKLSIALHNETAVREVYPLRQIQSKLDRLLGRSERLLPWSGSRDFLSDVSTNSGILAPVDSFQQHYRYIHRWFREYLAALALSRADESDVADFINQKVGDSGWSEVLVLYAGMSDHPNEYITNLLRGPRGTALRALAEVATIDVDVALQVLNLRSEDQRERRSVFGQLQTMMNNAELTRLLTLYVRSASQGIPRCDLYFVQKILVDIALPAAQDLLGRLFEQIGEPPDGLLDKTETAAWGSVPYWCDVGDGSFEFGAADGDPLKPDWVPSSTLIETKAFQIGIVPVTFGLYWHFDPSLVPPKNLIESVPRSEIYRHPAVNISWYEATVFCQWISKRYPGVRLPNEYEWERAASWDEKISAKRRFPWGDDWDECRLNSWHKGPNRSTPVGAYPNGASPYGVLDMAGNVWEWCANWFFEDTALTQLLLAGGLVPEVIDNGRFRRVDRGGGWYHDVGTPATFLRAADDPADRFSHCGFRLVRDVGA